MAGYLFFDEIRFNVQQHRRGVDAAACFSIPDLIETKKTLVIRRVAWIDFNHGVGDAMQVAGHYMHEVEKGCQQFIGAQAGTDGEPGQFAYGICAPAQGIDFPAIKIISEQPVFRIDIKGQGAEGVLAFAGLQGYMVWAGP